MKYTIIIISSLLFTACFSDVHIPVAEHSDIASQSITSDLHSNETTQSATPITKDSFLFEDWVYDKIPNNRGATSEDQMTMRQVFGSTRLTLTKDDYTLSMMGTMDTGTWKSLVGDTYELKSASGRTQKIGLKKINNNQMIFTFLGDKELQMRKSGDSSNN